MRPRQPVARHRVAERRRLVEPRADDEQRVGGVEPCLDRRRGTEPGHPEIERVVVRDDVGTPPGGDDRDLEELGEAEQLGRGPGAQHAATGQDDRPLGGGQELDDRPDLVVAWRAAAGGRAASVPGVVGHRLVEEVLGQREQDRARPAAERLADRFGHRVRDLVGGVRFGGPLGEPAERRDLVDLLEGLAPEEGALDLADRHEHRGRVLARGVDADGEVRATDRARPERDRRASGQLAVRFGHERGRALVTRGDDPDPGALEGVEQAEERFARAR